MSLLAPGWLILGALTIFVLVLHMRARRHIVVPSIMLWRLLGEVASPRKSLRLPVTNALLLLQLAIVVLIVLALAQPLLGGEGKQVKHTIYVLDTSASMRATDQAPSRFDAALTTLTTRVQAATAVPGNRVSIITVGAPARVAVARQAANKDVLPLLATLRASDGPAAWEDAAGLIPSLLRESEPARVVVLTDASDPAAAAIGNKWSNATVERVLFGRGDAANRGLVATVTPTNLDAGEWQVTGTVRFSGAAADTAVQASFQPAGSTGFVAWAKADVTAPREMPAGPDGTPAPLAEAPFTLKLQVPGPGALLLQLPQDLGPHDNALHFVLRRNRTAQILYVGETTRPLLAALQAIDNVEVVAANELPGNDSTFDLVVLDNVAVSRRPATNALWVGNAHLESQPAPPVLRDPYLTGWDTTHPLSNQVDWTALTTDKGFRVQRLAGAVVLAESAGAPLVQARTTVRGREVVIALDLAESRWPERAAFPVFINNLVRWLGLELGPLPTPCVAGAACTMEARSLSGRVFGPDGSQVWTGATEAGDFLLPEVEHSFVPARAGFYRLEAGATGTLVAVNPTDAETALTPLPGETPPAPKPGAAVAWPWLLAGVFILLLIEAWKAGRGPEQFLRRAALANTNPLAVRRRLQLGLRAAAAAFVIAAVAGLPIPGRAPAEDVVVVLGTDLGPQSQNPDRARLLREIETKIASGAGHVGLVTAGNAVQIAADLDGARATAAAPAAAGTNLEQALLVAAAMMPSGARGRIVLGADGNETRGDVAMAIGTLRVRGLGVDIQPLTELPPGEVLVESINAPPRVYVGDTFILDAVIYSQGPAPAKVTIRRAGEVVLEQQVDLFPGRNRVETLVPAGESGNLLLEVAVDAARDVFKENNRNGLIVDVARSPAIAIVTPEAEAGAFFAQALAVQGLKADVIDPKKAPAKIDKWLEYDSVVLMNTPAIMLDTTQQEQIEQLVQVHGRGLLILGGENSFGPGGYFETPFERLSPLSSRVPHDRPQVAIVFVLDRSGSMTAAADERATLTRLDVAKQATMAAVSLLSDESQIGVVVFDHEAYVLVPLQRRKNEAAVAEALEPLIPGGGTYIFPGVAFAVDMLAKAEAASRHVVVMTDGLSQEADFTAIMARAKQAGISISAIAISSAADPRQPQQIAEKGGGAFYWTHDMRALPSILSQEVLMLETAPLKEETAPVVWVNRGADFLAGLPDRLPPVHGFVRTTAKPLADLHMSVRDIEGEMQPLLASWRYGNGKVLALATHGAGAGTQEWINMPEYPLLWSQAIRHFLPDAAGPGLHVGLHREGDMVRVTADLLDPNGDPIRQRAVTASAEAAGGTPVTLAEIAPGRYEGSLPVTEAGFWKVNVDAGDLKAEATAYVGYPARFDFGRSDFDKLRALAAATGGKVLLGNEPVLRESGKWVALPGWRVWTLAALLFFMLDLGIRHAPNMFGLMKRATPLAPPRQMTA